MNIETKTLKSSNGISALAGILYLPTNEPKALIQISPGMVEHIGRYDEFMTFFANEGYVVMTILVMENLSGLMKHSDFLKIKTVIKL